MRIESREKAVVSPGTPSRRGQEVTFLPIGCQLWRSRPSVRSTRPGPYVGPALGGTPTSSVWQLPGRRCRRSRLRFRCIPRRPSMGPGDAANLTPDGRRRAGDRCAGTTGVRRTGPAADPVFPPQQSRGDTGRSARMDPRVRSSSCARRGEAIEVRSGVAGWAVQTLEAQPRWAPRRMSRNVSRVHGAAGNFQMSGSCS